MSLNRRGFLGAAAAFAVAASIDPERLLWTPGKKLISIPDVTLLPPREFHHLQVTQAVTSEEFALFLNGHSETFGAMFWEPAKVCLGMEVQRLEREKMRRAKFAAMIPFPKAMLSMVDSTNPRLPIRMGGYYDVVAEDFFVSFDTNVQI